MAEDEDDTSDGVTTSRVTRSKWLGTVLALITVISPYVYVGYELYVYGEVSQWLIAIVMLISLTGAVWWAGAGALQKASEALGGGGN